MLIFIEFSAVWGFSNSKIMFEKVVFFEHTNCAKIEKRTKKKMAPYQIRYQNLLNYI